MTHSTNEDGLIELWPVPLLSKRLDNHQAVNRELMALFLDYRDKHASETEKIAFSSPDNFSNDVKSAALDTLKQFLMDGVYEIAVHQNQQHWSMLGLKSLDVDITGLWFQISNQGAFHETHVHGNCSWSGVYYVQAGQASRHQNDRLPNGMLNGVTRFYGPHMEYNAGGHGDYGNYYLQNSTFTSFPQDGQLVVFPSYLKHMAYPYSGEDDRIIVSFHAQISSEDVTNYKYSFF